MSSLCESNTTSPEAKAQQVLLAFGLTTLAGLATTLGALVPIFVTRAKPIYLASALSFAAGVMLYVSFVEIMKKSQEYLACTTEHSALASVGCFFVGVVGTMLLHLFVHKLEEFPLQKFAKTLIRKRSYSQYGTLVVSEEGTDALLRKEEEGQAVAAGRTGLHTVNTQLPSDRKSSAEAPKKQGGVRSWLWGSRSKQQQQQQEEQQVEEEEDRAIIQDMLGSAREEPLPQGNTGQSGGGTATSNTQDEKDRLQKMGLMTALAIGLHNFPEGMAAFVATLSATSLGLAVTFAVAIHNIPEGICVSMPLYYATGSKKKAFFWAFISGISEPIGAVVCYLAFYDGFNTVLYGVLFGMIAGMMVFITLKELLPTAHKYDASDTIVTPFIFVGMAVMGGSLLLFEYTA